ncbi:hypothetical protein [Cellulomonas sp. Y8]|uniref:hypothetical protein n=1 Tax=Cellulomonas sp. Y8 TaxID=2591145 RepID=UPI0011CB83EB|nr:hypothetical protein [Cellulomonas sp. Y8]
MPAHRFVSYAARNEDVVLHRALGHLPAPRYLELAPDDEDRCAALREHGWAGGPGPAPAVDGPVDGLHALVVGPDAAGVAAEAVASGLRPWVVLAPAGDVPGAASLVAALEEAGYRATLFDGASRYHVAPEHLAALGASLDHPAGPEDDYTSAAADLLERENARLTAEVGTWRTRAVDGWALTAAEAMGSGGEAEHLAREIEAMRRTLSWRITKPLRLVRSRVRR